jgi:hypothetical protein
VLGDEVEKNRENKIPKCNDLSRLKIPGRNTCMMIDARREVRDGLERGTSKELTEIKQSLRRPAKSKSPTWRTTRSIGGSRHKKLFDLNSPRSLVSIIERGQWHFLNCNPISSGRSVEKKGSEISDKGS